MDDRGKKRRPSKSGEWVVWSQNITYLFRSTEKLRFFPLRVYRIQI